MYEEFATVFNKMELLRSQADDDLFFHVVLFDFNIFHDNSFCCLRLWRGLTATNASRHSNEHYHAGLIASRLHGTNQVKIHEMQTIERKASCIASQLAEAENMFDFYLKPCCDKISYFNTTWKSTEPAKHWSIKRSAATECPYCGKTFPRPHKQMNQTWHNSEHRFKAIADIL